MAEHRTLTQEQLLAEARERFGDDPLTWAFVCPRCGDVANAGDFKAAGADPNRVGQECIGRSLGALRGSRNDADGTTRGEASRGCDWCAYGLFSGPWTVELPDGKKVGSFELAPATRTEKPVTAELSRPARDLLGMLQFRDDLGTSYLVQAGYGREALVVPQMTESRSLSRLRAFNYEAIRQLREAGLVEVDRESTRIEFAGRKRLDKNWCATAIRLTDAGRAEPTPTNARRRAEEADRG